MRTYVPFCTVLATPIKTLVHLLPSSAAYPAAEQKAPWPQSIPFPCARRTHKRSRRQDTRRGINITTQHVETTSTTCFQAVTKLEPFGNHTGYLPELASQQASKGTITDQPSQATSFGLYSKRITTCQAFITIFVLSIWLWCLLLACILCLEFIIFIVSSCRKFEVRLLLKKFPISIHPLPVIRSVTHQDI